MATKYLIAAGGNWTADATWSSTSAAGSADTTAPTASDDVIAELLSGQVTISATSVCKSFSATAGTGEYTGTFTHNAFTWTVSGSITFSAGMTYTPLATATVIMNISGGTLTSAGKLFPLMSFTNGSDVALQDNLSFIDSKVLTVTLSGNNVLNVNAKTVSAFSNTSRVLIRSSTLGTARNLATSGTFNGFDFRDITASSTWNLSAASNYAGDCGGNTNITFTTAATQTYTGGTDSWSTAARWTSRVPLPQDDVAMSGVTGGTITADMPRLGKSIDWTGASGTPTCSVSQAIEIYGSLTLISAMTWTNAQTTSFMGRGIFTLTSAGKTVTTTDLSFAMVGGQITLQDALVANTSGSNRQILFTDGTFISNGFNVTGQIFGDGFTGRTKAINMGSSIWSTAWSFTTLWNFQQGGLTLTPGTSTIYFIATNGGTNTFAGGGRTYYDFKIGAGGTSIIAITGANTFNRIYTDGGGTKSIVFPGSTTTTITGSVNGLANGTNLITFTASAGSATIAHTPPLIWDYVSLTNIISSGGAAYAGPLTHSTNGGGNTNWTFASPLSGGVGTGRGTKMAIGLMI